MAKTDLATHHHGPDVAMLPEMHVRPADARRPHVHQAVVGARLGHVGRDNVQFVLRVGVHRDVRRLALQDVVGSHGDVDDCQPPAAVALLNCPGRRWLGAAPTM